MLDARCSFYLRLVPGRKKVAAATSRESDAKSFFLLLGLLAPVDGSELGVSANLFLCSPQSLAPEFALQKRAFVEFWKPPDFFVITL